MSNPSSTPAARLLLVDALRGFAIVLMVVYHFCFDLSYFRLASFDFYHDAFWLHARTFILSLFLGLVGVSLVLATRKGLDLSRYFKRLAMILASAALVSAGTWWMFGDRFVFFGVLHFIALASVLGLGFVRAGWWNLLPGIGLILLAGHYQSGWFDAPGRRWIGLTTHKPLTEDYVPLLPWFGVVLLGMALGPVVIRLARRSAVMMNRHGVFHALAFGGRHSLIIYLLHQPLMIAALSAYVKLAV